MAPSHLALVAASILLLSTSPVHAKDFCFNSTSPPNPAPANDPDILIVAQNFKVPRKGKCKVVTGFEIAFFGQTRPRAVSGSVCLNDAGDHLRGGFTIHPTQIHFGAGGQYEAAKAIPVAMDLPYPALTGGAVYLEVSTTLLFRNDGVAGPCGFRLPIP